MTLGSVDASPHTASGDVLLDHLFETVPVGVAFFDTNGRYLRVNAVLAAINGVAAAAHRDRSPREVLGEADGGAMEETLERVLATGEPVLDVAKTVSSGTGAARRFLADFLPLRDADGRISALQAIVREDTPRWRAEEQRVRQVADERRARAEAEAASQAKSGFLASLSHEIRTPVNAIIGYAELLEMGLSGPLTEQQRRQIGRIRTSSRHLLALLTDVIDLAKVEAGRLTVVRERGSAGVAVDSALTIVRPAASARRVDVEVRGGREGVMYVGDPRRVRQIVVNLLSNAVRFAPEGSRLRVQCTLTDLPDAAARLEAGTRCWCAIAVEDCGIGVAPAMQEQIFEPFVQGDPVRDAANGGAGLGLAISRRLARLMGGDITLRSSPGEGAAFTLWLPAPPIVVDDPARAGGCAIVERRGSARHARGLVAVGDAIRADAEGLVARYVRRLRDDPGITGARALTDTELAGHTTTLLADLAQSLEIIESSSGEPTELMRDGSEIQRVIAERHGRLRQQLSWSAAELDRDFDLLRTEIADTVSASVSAMENVALEDGLRVVRRLLERARVASQMAYRAAER